MTRAQWMVVTGLLLFILLIFGTLLFQLQVPAAPSVTSVPPSFLLEERARAKTVFPVAQEAALKWQPDAQLSSAAIVWNDLGPGGVIKRDRWTFEFYSPSQQEMAVIRVIDDQAERLRTTLLPNPLPPVPLEQWRIDSTEALQTWWAHGGGDFVQEHDTIAISLKLRKVPGYGDPRWIVTGSSSAEHWVVQIDSGNGSVVP